MTRNLAHISLHTKGRYDELFFKLSQLQEGCRDLETIAHRYDFSSQVPGNGIRSFIHVCDILMQKLEVLLPANDSHSQKLVKDYETFAGTLLKVLLMMQEVRMKGPDIDYSVISDIDRRIKSYAHMFSESDIRPIFDRSSIGPFWLPDFVQREILTRNIGMHFLQTDSWFDALKLLFSASFAGETMARTAINFSLAGFQRMMSAITKFPINFLMRFAPKPKGIQTQEVWIERKSEYLIRVKDTQSPAVITKSSVKRGGSIRCVLVTPSSQSPDSPPHDQESLMVHIHGGAFMMGKPENFLPSFANACRDLNLPVVSIDYRLAPEHRYPYGLQDVLDVYLWLTSGSDEVEQMLGFRPKNLILTGESSGGHMCVALSLALQQMKDSGIKVLLPTGLSLLFPVVVVAPIASPAGLLVTIDPVLTAGMSALTLTCYPALDVQVPDGWHRNHEQSERVMKSLEHRILDPLYNVLTGDSIQKLRDVRLSLLLCEFDPLLDQGIAIARRWPSTPRLMISKSMPHGLTLLHTDKVPHEMQWMTDGIRSFMTQ